MNVVVPPGDPETLRAAARALRESARTGGRGARTARGHSGDLGSAWRGPAGDDVRRGLDVVGRYAADCDPALTIAAAALEEYASVLSEAQSGARVLAAHLQEAQDAHRWSLRRAADGPADLRGARLREAEHTFTATRTRVERASAELESRVAAAATAVQRRLHEASAGFGAASAWAFTGGPGLADRVRDLLQVQVPVLRGHPDLVRAMLWAAGTGAAVARHPAGPRPSWREAFLDELPVDPGWCRRHGGTRADPVRWADPAGPPAAVRLLPGAAGPGRGRRPVPVWPWDPDGVTGQAGAVVRTPGGAGGAGPRFEPDTGAAGAPARPGPG